MKLHTTKRIRPQAGEVWQSKHLATAQVVIIASADGFTEFTPTEFPVACKYRPWAMLPRRTTLAQFMDGFRPLYAAGKTWIVAKPAPVAAPQPVKPTVKTTGGLCNFRMVRA